MFKSVDDEDSVRIGQPFATCLTQCHPANLNTHKLRVWEKANQFFFCSCSVAHFCYEVNVDFRTIHVCFAIILNLSNLWIGKCQWCAFSIKFHSNNCTWKLPMKKLKHIQIFVTHSVDASNTTNTHTHTRENCKINLYWKTWINTQKEKKY